MTEKKPRTALLGGLWLNPSNLQQSSALFPVPSELATVSFVGLPSTEERVDHLLRFLTENPEITQLVAHSAACNVIRAALSTILSKILKVVLLNPAPLPGVKFGLGDPLFWITAKYGLSLLSGRSVRPTQKEFAKLSVPLSMTEYEWMLPDNGKYLRELSMAQWRRKRKVTGTTEVITYFAGTKDTMLGSTQDWTEALWHGCDNPEELEYDREQFYKRVALRGGPEEISGSHFGSMRHFHKTLDFLREKAGFTL